MYCDLRKWGTFCSWFQLGFWCYWNSYKIKPSASIAIAIASFYSSKRNTLACFWAILCISFLSLGFNYIHNKVHRAVPNMPLLSVSLMISGNAKCDVVIFIFSLWSESISQWTGKGNCWRQCCHLCQMFFLPSIGGQMCAENVGWQKPYVPCDKRLDLQWSESFDSSV